MISTELFSLSFLSLSCSSSSLLLFLLGEPRRTERFSGSPLDDLARFFLGGGVADPESDSLDEESRLFTGTGDAFLRRGGGLSGEGDLRSGEPRLRGGGLGDN